MPNYNHWEQDLKDSAKALKSIEHTYLPKVISGKIHSIESSNNKVLILFDQKSGIDYIRENETGLQGIAARVQWGNNWDTFTIRASRHTGTKTEFEKRQESIKEGYFYPAFTLQAYFDDRTTNKFLSLGIIKTLDLYQFIKNTPNKVHQRKSDNLFFYVYWKDLTELIKIQEPQ